MGSEFIKSGNINPQRLQLYVDDNAAASVGTLTSDNTNVADGDTVTIGSTVYRFKNTMAAAYDVKIGADADASLLNLIKAINGTGVAGTNYFAGTVAHPSVTAASAVTSHAFAVTASTAGLAGNSIATTETSAHLAWGAATLASGGSTIGTATIGDDGGVLRQITVVAPNVTGTPTYTVEVVSADGDVLYLSTAQNENATVSLSKEIVVRNGDLIRVTTSTKIEETSAFYVDLR